MSILTADECNAPPRHAERLGEEAQQLIVRPALDRGRGKADLEGTTMDARDFSVLRARLGVNLERD